MRRFTPGRASTGGSRSARRNGCELWIETRREHPHTYARTRETGTAYGNNPAAERAARRLRTALETARNFAFSSPRTRSGSPARDKSASIRAKRTRPPLRRRQLGSGSAIVVRLVSTQGGPELLEDLAACASPRA